MTRQLVLHEDDVGMCHGANSAFLELTALGACSSGAVMVPCPWFPEMAEAAAADPRLDLGVHLTLNSEKQHYKWRPLTSPSRAAGLTDEFGYFWPDVATTRRKAAPQAVETELRAQIDTAYRAGIDVTHLDAHMGAALSPEFLRRLHQARPGISLAGAVDQNAVGLFAQRQSGWRHRSGVPARRH
ncbi:ChbG/HpnK family deacetylase [Mesorhizobium sp. M0659]|uniref:ChbG/HpnK family deacetylase n=1 Tax=Mesorhizobium sp. M0659 TaxID=2956980 RepID=UPI00333B7716